MVGVQMVPAKLAASALVLISLMAVLPWEADAAPAAILPATFDEIITSPYLPRAEKEVDLRHQGCYALVYYAFGYMEARRNDWRSAWSGDARQLLSPEFTYLMAADVNGRNILSVGAALATWGTCTYAELGPAAHEYPTGEPAYWTTKVWSHASERSWREAPEHRPMGGYAIDYDADGLARLKSLIVQGNPVVLAAYGLAGSGPNGFMDDDWVVSSGELMGGSFSHYVTIIGFDDTMTNDGEKGAVRVIAPFGAAFADRGSFWITYSALQAMAGLDAKDLTPYVDSAFLYYLDAACAPPTVLLIWEYDTPPTLDCALEISVVSQDGSQLSSPIRPSTGSRWYSYVHHFPRFLCLDISAWAYMLRWPEAVLRMDQATTPKWAGLGGSIGCLVVEIYGGDYSSTARQPPTMVSGQSVSGILWTPFRVQNDLTFIQTVPLAEAADAAGRHFLSGGAWTFYGTEYEGAVGGSCLRTPESPFREETRLETEMIGPGTVSFRWMAVGDGIQGGLEFRLDGEVSRRVFGNTAWSQVDIPIPAGVHMLTWATRHEDEGSRHTLDDYYLIDSIAVRGDDDLMEENDHPSRGAALPEGTSELTCSDDDWFSVQLGVGDGFRAELRETSEIDLAFFLRLPGGGDRQAVAEGGGQVIALERSLTYCKALLCVSPIGIEVGRYSLSLELRRAVDLGSESSLCIVAGDGMKEGAVWQLDTVENGRIGFSATLAWNSQWSEAADLVMIANWGEHSGAYSVFPGMVPAGVGGAVLDISGMNAPGTAGTYWIFMAYRHGVDAARLASGSFDGGTARWDDGDDIGDLGGADIDAIYADGRVWLACHSEDGSSYLVPIPCAALRVDVADVSPPVTVVSLAGEGGSNGWYRSQVEVSLCAADPSGVSATEYALDGGRWTRYEAPFRVLLDGHHTLLYRSIDALSHAEQERSAQFMIDTSAPYVSCRLDGAQGEEGWFISFVTVGIECLDEQSGCTARYRIDGREWTDLASPFVITESGRHLLEVDCRDGAGNSLRLAREVLMDAAPPSTCISLDGLRLDGGWFGSEVLARFSTIDMESAVGLLQVRLDAGEWKQSDGTCRIAVPGRHLLMARATDLAGNIGAAAIAIVNVDLRFPTVAVAGREDTVGAIAVNEPVLTLYGKDDVGAETIFARMDHGAWAATEDGKVNIPAGTHSLEAYAIDVAGRVGPIAAMTVVLDVEAPSVSLGIAGDSGTAGWYHGAVKLSLNVTDQEDARAKAVLWIDGMEAGPGPYLLDTLGWHKVVYMAMDGAGNSRGPFVEYIGVDAAAPMMSVTVHGERGANGWYRGGVTIDVALSDDASGVVSSSHRIDSQEWSEGCGPILVRYDGVHVVEVQCVDGAGNVATSRTALHIDSGGPVFEYRDGQVLDFKTRDLSLKLSLEDWCSGLSAITVRVDGGEALLLDPADPIITCTGLSDGKHDVAIAAADAAGNVETRNVSLLVNTDILDPDGPYGWIPLGLLTMGACLGAAAIVRRASRYR
jgi:hypothetical protein